MATANVRGLNINYEIIGDSGPAVALVTGGRRGYAELIPLANKIAKNGYRVFLHDRRNTGASDILIKGEEVEEITWADDLHELLKQHDALPGFIGGSSAGARTAMLFSIRHPEAVKGLLLLRVTGGAFAAGRLPENYYGQYIRIAEEGGMEAIRATDQYRERMEANAGNKEKLENMSAAEYIAAMKQLMAHFVAGVHHPVMGISPDDVRSITAPTMIIPGNDNTHSSESARVAHGMIPGCEIHPLPIEDIDVPLIPYEEWAPHEPEITETFVDFMKRVEAG
jgi:pimeloyl-ACP methyl ester carboxylesterase